MTSIAGFIATTRQAARHSVAQANRQARTWSWPGWVGLIGVVAAALASYVWLPALQVQSDSNAAEIAAAELRIARLALSRPATAPQRPASQRFRDGFPAARERQERLAAMLSLATAHGLAPKRSEFRLSRDADLGLLRYSVGMPLTGPYAQVRAFVEEAQLRDPALSLDQMRLRRSSAASATVDTELSWTFYMQAEPPTDVAGGDVRSASR